MLNLPPRETVRVTMDVTKVFLRYTACVDSMQEKQIRLKSLRSTYEPDVRTFVWLKLKKDYIDGVGDSIDVVPVGAWHGNG